SYLPLKQHTIVRGVIAVGSVAAREVLVYLILETYRSHEARLLAIRGKVRERQRRKVKELWGEGLTTGVMGLLLSNVAKTV
ncbi:MAG: hypothetical protein Q9194_004620, partial [Teloschistes cf. exilis]